MDHLTHIDRLGVLGGLFELLELLGERGVLVLQRDDLLVLDKQVGFARRNGTIGLFAAGAQDNVLLVGGLELVEDGRDDGLLVVANGGQGQLFKYLWSCS